MVAAAADQPTTWSGTQEELAEFLVGVRRGCKECGAKLTFKTPCAPHQISEILKTYSQESIDLLIGQKRDPDWARRWGRGEMAPTIEPRVYTPREWTEEEQ